MKTKIVLNEDKDLVEDIRDRLKKMMDIVLVDFLKQQILNVCVKSLESKKKENVIVAYI